MSLNSLEQLIPMQTLGILIVVLYVIGVILKNTPNIKDWCIPWILLVLGIIGSIALQIGSASIPLAVLQGVVCAGITVLGNQLYVQTRYKKGLNGQLGLEVPTEEPKETMPVSNGEVAEEPVKVVKAPEAIKEQPVVEVPVKTEAPKVEEKVVSSVDKLEKKIEAAKAPVIVVNDSKEAAKTEDVVE